MSQVDVREAHRWSTRGGAVLVDVREPDEYAAGHAPGSVPVPLGGLRAEHLPLGVDVLMICRSGRRSETAVRRAVAGGVRAVNVTGGVLAWVEAGLPLVRTDGGPGEVR